MTQKESEMSKNEFKPAVKLREFSFLMHDPSRSITKEMRFSLGARDDGEKSFVATMHECVAIFDEGELIHLIDSLIALREASKDK
jgi:hypothetical protein